ncbi:MAG: hypothetical protein JNG83_06680 [Opitutaceae bacterium]|nr:hypothetical protein [Opitutaceae bacterium]
MTITTPSLPTDLTAPAAPGAEAELLAALGAAGAPPAAAVPASASDGFAALLPEASAPEPEPAAAGDEPAEQAGALAALLFWSPAPMLVENPPPAVPEFAGEAPAEENGAPMTGCGDDGAGDLPRAVVAVRLPPVAADAGPAAAPALPGCPAPAQPPAAPSPAPRAPSEPARPPAADPATAIPAAASVPPPQAAASAGAEKFAHAADLIARRLDLRINEQGKTYVSNYGKMNKEEVEFVGTAVAEEATTMHSAPVAPPARSESESSLPVFPVNARGGVLADSPALPQFQVAASEDPAVQARDTVAAVVRVVEAQQPPAPGASRVVHLDFNFGEERLAVRVELRDGAVQAHFRTRSKTLQAALSHEWQQAAAAPDNLLRYAEPVFLSSSRSEQLAGFGVDADASHQQPRFQPPARELSAFASGAPARRPAAAEAEATDDRLRHLPNALHLQAVA